MIRKLAKKMVPAGLQPAAVTARYLQALRQNDQIRSGPFQGLRFTWEKWDENFSIPAAKFLGSYELELVPVIERLLRRPFAHFVDVGAAEGYYALGWAFRNPHIEVTAFELLANGRAEMARLAKINGVESRLSILGKCEVPDLARALTRPGPSLLMTDVEGYEEVLLDPVAIPALVRTTILFEAHDCYIPAVGQKICARFKPTHDIEEICYRPRTIADLKCVSPWLKLYAKHNLLGWMGERMFAMSWFCLTPKSLPSA